MYRNIHIDLSVFIDCIQIGEVFSYNVNRLDMGSSGELKYLNSETSSTDRQFSKINIMMQHILILFISSVYLVLPVSSLRQCNNTP